MEGQFNLQALVKKVEELLCTFVHRFLVVGWGWREEHLQLICVDLSWDMLGLMGRSKRREERKLKKQAQATKLRISGRFVAVYIPDQVQPSDVHSFMQKILLVTLSLFNIAMENGPFIDGFPINTSIHKGFSMAMLNNQMVFWVHILSRRHFPTFISVHF